MKEPSVAHRSVSLRGRSFRMRFIAFSNGCFLLISEGGEERIGSLTLSMRIHEKVGHTTVIPERYAGVFSSILAEMVANITEGITLTSLYLASSLDEESARDLLKKVRDLVNTAREQV